MFSLFSKNYLKGAREIGSDELRLALEAALAPWSRRLGPGRQDFMMWLWADDSYMLLTERNIQRFALEQHVRRGTRIYAKQRYDCDDFARVWLGDMSQAAAKYSFPRPPALGWLDYYPAGTSALDETRHASGWVAFQTVAGGIGFLEYEPQPYDKSGPFYHPKARIKETILAYG